MNVNFCFFVAQVDEFYFKLGTPDRLIEAHVDNIVRSQLPKLDLDAAFLVKDELAMTIKRELANSMSVYGLIIYDTLMVITLSSCTRAPRATHTADA